MSIQDLDYQTLAIFCQLHRHGSASAVANTLGISASKVSRRLGCLRRLFGDELFVRRGGTLMATGRARELLPLAQQMVETYRALGALSAEAEEIAPQPQSEAARVARPSPLPAPGWGRGELWVSCSRGGIQTPPAAGCDPSFGTG